MIRATQHSANSMTVQVGGASFLMSYETCVAFQIDREPWVLCENVWSRTTGKHIGQHFDPTYPRTPYVEFTKMLRALDVTIREEAEA